MGIQLSVHLEDLPKSFKQELVSKIQYDYDYEGNEIPYNTEVLYVTFPSGKIVRSYSRHGLCFDNKYANMDLRDELNEHKVPYVLG